MAIVKSVVKNQSDQDLLQTANHEILHRREACCSNCCTELNGLSLQIPHWKAREVPRVLELALPGNALNFAELRGKGTVPQSWMHEAGAAWHLPV